MEKRTRLNLITTISLLAIMGNGVAMSKKIDTVHGKTVTPLQVLSRSEQELQKHREKEEEQTTSKNPEIAIAKKEVYTGDNGYLIKEMAVESKGIKEDLDTQNVVATIKNIKEGKEVGYEAKPKDKNIEVIMQDSLVVKANETDTPSNVKKLEDIKTNYEEIANSKIEEQKEKEESIKKEIEGLKEELSEADKKPTKKESIISVKEKLKDEKDLEEQKKQKEEELNKIKEKQSKLEKDIQENAKKYEEEIDKLNEKSKNFDTEVLKIVEESTGEDGQEYVRVVNKQDDSEIGWVKKADLSETYETVSEVKKSNWYATVNDKAVGYTFPKGTSNGKPLEKQSKNIMVVEKVILSNGEEWYKSKNDEFYLANDLTDITGKQIEIDVKEGDNIDEILASYGKTKEDVQTINPFTDFSKPITGKITIQKRDMLEVYNPADYTTNKQTQEFLAEIIQYSSEIKQAGLLPSVTLGQAIHESAEGTSKLATDDHNLFGIKGQYKGVSGHWDTKEDYGSGEVGIQANFRKYPSKEESIIDYLDLITGRTGNNRYKNAVGVKDPFDAITIIWKGGYATDQTYDDKVMRTIDKFNLTILDK